VSIDIRQVEHIAALARLYVADGEKETFRLQLSNILDYIEKLNELDTSGAEPTAHVIDISNVMREDVADRTISPDDALANAPDRSDNFYRVPRIIE
jgi:aspartyl-tRNA(Asn)/glutamyl-tRNA(Gln) amidotransferase subunit C